jgi:hypothetical protein
MKIKKLKKSGNRVLNFFLSRQFKICLAQKINFFILKYFSVHFATRGGRTARRLLDAPWLVVTFKQQETRSEAEGP